MHADHQFIFWDVDPDVLERSRAPHFHCVYGEYEAVIGIRDLQVIEGELPRRALNLVLDWAELHQAELLEDWELCRAKQQPKPIAPLE